MKSLDEGFKNMNVREKNKGLESSYSDGIDRKILHKERAKI